MGFDESASITKEEQAPTNLINAIKEVEVAATADKEHIQQMSTATDNLLAVVERQREQLDSLTKQLHTITSQNGQLIEALSKLKPPPHNNRDRRNNINKRQRDKSNEEKDTDKENKVPRTGDRCPICNLLSHKMDKCWELEANAHLCPSSCKSILKK